MDNAGMYKKIYIYGAHGRGRTLKKYLQTLNSDIEVEAYLVDDGAENPEVIEEVPVYAVNELNELKNIPVFVATKVVYHEKIAQSLSRFDVKTIVWNTPQTDNAIKKMYFKKVFKECGRELKMLEDYQAESFNVKNDICSIYMVKSVFDTANIEDRQTEPWIKEIQAGAALTDKRIAPVSDSTGENISIKNRQYCELTAIYWLWKNLKKDYVGVCHYRRRFVLNEDMLRGLEKYDIDVVLPVPTGCEPSVEENYYQRHRAGDWNMMLEVIRGYYPEYYSEAQRVFKGNYYYACNMWIMKYPVLDKFAAWLFDILGKIEEKINNTDTSYQGRYIGFLAERLTTLYFIVHWDNYNIVHADKLFLK